MLGTWFTNVGAEREENADHAAAIIAVLCALVAVGSLFVTASVAGHGADRDALGVVAYFVTRADTTARSTSPWRPPRSWWPRGATSATGYLWSPRASPS